MPKSILVLQTENDLFHPDFDKIRPKITICRPFISFQNSQMLLGKAQLTGKSKGSAINFLQ